MCLRERPTPFSPGIVRIRTFVAITSSSRLESSFGSTRPVMTSLSPPL